MPSTTATRAARAAPLLLWLLGLLAPALLASCRATPTPTPVPTATPTSTPKSTPTALPTETPTAQPTQASLPLVVLHTNDNWGETNECN